MRATVKRAASLANALLVEARSLQHHCQELEAILDDLPDATVAGHAARRFRRNSAPEHQSEFEAARLAAMELALGGATESQVASYLKEHLAPREVVKVLRAVYGR